MLLETIARLLPFIMLGLIGLFVVVLSIEIQKQSRAIVQKQENDDRVIMTALNLLIILFITATIIHCVIHFIIPPIFISLIPFVLWGGLSNLPQEPTQQQKQHHQRTPIVSPSNQSQPKTESQQRVVIIPPRHTQASIDKSLHPSSSNFPTSENPASPKQNSSFQRQQLNPLQPKLLNLLNGDRNGAERLLRHAKQMNPGMSENWYFEKVIYDIERDRR
jgi:hypothetical protein